MIARKPRELPSFDPAVVDQLCGFFDERFFEMADELQKRGWRRGVDMDNVAARQLAADLLSWARLRLDELAEEAGAAEPPRRGRP